MLHVKHLYLAGETVGTKYGVCQLDANGVVTNLHELSCDAETLVEQPGFFPSQVGPAPSEVKADVVVTSVAKEEDLGASAEQATADHQQQVGVVIEMLAGDSPFDSNGKLHLERLNSKLKSLKLPRVSGTQRDALVAEASAS